MTEPRLDGGYISTAWAKSSFSTTGEGCVQVRSAQDGLTEVGDTKNPGGPTLLLPNAAWIQFLDQVMTGSAVYVGRLQPRFLPDGGFTLHDTEHAGSPVLTYTRAEWDAFRAGVLAGELRLFEHLRKAALNTPATQALAAHTREGCES